MDQSKSNSKKQEEHHVEAPPRRFTLEFWVGLFTLVSVFCAGWLAVGLGGLDLFSSDSYRINAEFDNISGLKTGASVEIAGVQIGTVNGISLNDPYAVVAMNIYNDFQIRDDDIASVRTKGIIGDRFVKISRGASDIFLSPGEMMTETESAVDIEDIIGKIVHSLEGGDDEEDSTEKGKE